MALSAACASTVATLRAWRADAVTLSPATTHGDILGFSREVYVVDDRSTAELVAAATDGDHRAWDELVDRHAGLVLAVCRRFRLSDADVHDVSQTVWLRLVEHL